MLHTRMMKSGRPSSMLSSLTAKESTGPQEATKRTKENGGGKDTTSLPTTSSGAKVSPTMPCEARTVPPLTKKASRPTSPAKRRWPRFVSCRKAQKCLKSYKGKRRRRAARLPTTNLTSQQTVPDARITANAAETAPAANTGGANTESDVSDNYYRLKR